MSSTLEIRNLKAGVEGKTILKGVDLTIKQDEIHALMGPNGSGKSTLAHILMGHPNFSVIEGDALIDGKSILDLAPDERAREGLFLAFQYPVTVQGLGLFTFLRDAYNAVHHKDGEGRKITPMEFREMLQEKLDLLGMDEDFANRNLNEGFSGGEKKRGEVLQMAVIEPKFAIMDETDSGLDIDALQVVADGVNKLAGPDMGILLITHYQRILNYIRPDKVHVMIGGRIAASGEAELAEKLEEEGYDGFREEVDVASNA